MTNDEIKAEMSRIYQETKELPKETRFKTKNELESAAREKWNDRVFYQYGYELNHEQHKILMAKAWEDGHASGWWEVEMHFGDLCDLAREIVFLSK